MSTRVNRRWLLRSMGLGGATLLTPGAASAATRGRQAAIDDEPPRTGYEQADGARWTTHEEEVAFLDEVEARSSRARVEEIGRTSEGRPVHIVTLGAPRPRGAGAARRDPVLMHLGCHHGNEPAGREAVLMYLRDLAFTDDPVLVDQLSSMTILVNPTTNPDGRANNTRGNGTMDLNRDHHTLTQPETRALHEVIRDYRPDVMVDHHEYGPSVPVLYDAEILYLWPRNLNVDPQVRDLARTLCEEYVAKGARANGYTADEYGLYKAGAQEILQTAGGPDERISRNAAGLRHTLGMLIESAVSQSSQRPVEAIDSDENRRRRVNSQSQALDDTLRFMREQGGLAKFASDGAHDRAIRQGADQDRPVFFGGADNEAPDEDDIDDPPACHYQITQEEADELAVNFDLREIVTKRRDGGVSVEMGQDARPVIPLLLDPRGAYAAADGEPVYDCD